MNVHSTDAVFAIRRQKMSLVAAAMITADGVDADMFTPTIVDQTFVTICLTSI